MRPFNGEVPGLEEVRAALKAGLVVGIQYGEVTVELVIDFVSGIYVKSP